MEHPEHGGGGGGIAPERETPPGLPLHLIVDHYATHKHEEVGKWLKRHLRIILHFTPTGSSWMNLVERFFADLTGDCVREGSFASVRELVEAIDEFLAVRNEEPKRYVWRAKGEDILRKIEKAKAALDRVINS
jgi:transposase